MDAVELVIHEIWQWLQYSFGLLVTHPWGGIIVGIFLGLVTGSARDWIKHWRAGRRIRTMLVEEMQYNQELVQSVCDRVRAEVRLSEQTFKRDNAGGFTSEGNPDKPLLAFGSHMVSTKVWDGNISHLAAHFSTRQIREMMRFYGRLEDVRAVQTKYLDAGYRVSHQAGYGYSRVLEKMELFLAVKVSLLGDE